jgi:outer membrane receptor protein involved in Fe transport
MNRRISRTRVLAAASAIAIAATLSVAGAASAQTVTATLRGSVSEAGQTQPGATIVATDVNTGFVTRGTAGADGGYVLSGLRPGTYRVEVTAPDGSSTSQIVTLQVGQQAYLDLDVAAATAAVDPTATVVEDIVVVGRPVIEVRTSEVATNVTTQQINTLPQNNRNFLNFATLAPGVRLNNNEERQTFSGGANGAERDGSSLGSSQVNVFIDGVSLKSNVQQGGLVGQDSSRGNPFSQLAVQEFRVSTQNFKAEYEQAGTSIISAITRSGTNDFTGEVFGFYQDESMIEEDFFVDRDNREKPDLERRQYGLSLGGPIIRDRLHFFAAYEVNEQTRSNNVLPGGGPALQAQVPFDVSQFAGTFEAPFEEQLAFGKLTWRITDNQTLDVSVSYRDESDIRGFGGATTVEAAEEFINEVTTVRVQHNYEGAAFLNEFSFDYLTSTFEPTAANPNVPGRDYQGVIRVGGRDTTQAVEESRSTFRNNITFSPLDWNGEHLIKMGAKVSFQDYDITGARCRNPLFIFAVDPVRDVDFTFPFEACYSSGVPSVSVSNTQIGLFIQDDWQINEHLTFNLGLRWDYETNANNENYVTPADAVAALRALETTLSSQPGNFFRADDYISTGSNREPFAEAFQPRVGFSYDWFADQRTVLFGGFGRYYDRTLFRNAAEESLFRQVAVQNFQFSRDGSPRNGQPTIQWDPSYLSAAGLDALIASRTDLNGELRVFKNDQEPPYTDQFSIGLRQKLGDWNTSITLTRQIGKNEIGYFPANRNVQAQPNGANTFIPVPGFGNVVASNDENETRYTGIYVTADKPYTRDSGWGVTFAYTYSDAEAKGFLFNFDRPNIAEAPFVPNAADETHRIVASGILDLPFGLQGSTLITYGSGQPFFVVDLQPGFERLARLGNFGDAQSFSQVDLRLTKTFEVVSGQELELIAEVFNVFNEDNFGGYDGFIPPEGVQNNTNFGQPNSLGGPPRSFQLGMRYRW